MRKRSRNWRRGQEENTIIAGKKVELRNKRVADAANDYAWQTDSELARLDAAPRLTIDFAQYLLACADELSSPSPTRCRFAIDTLDGEHIGNCVYYGIDEGKGETELGIMIGNRDYWDKGYGTDAVTTMVGHIFRRTSLKRIYLKTLESNTRAQRCFRKCGFTPCGRMVRWGSDFLLMEMRREQWDEWQQSADSRVVLKTE